MEERMDIHEVRAHLAAVIRGLHEGHIGPKQANAVSNAIGKVLTSYRLEMDHLKLTGVNSRVRELGAGK
jgi:hypothetical protein